MQKVVSIAPRPTPSTKIGERDRLLSIISERSFSNDREVTLSSGKKSNLYFNMKPTMLDNEASYLIAKIIVEMIPLDADFVGGLEMGAVPIVASICPVAFLNDRKIRAFFVRKKAKEHGAKKLIEGLLENETLDGKKVVVVDDVTTTGGSVVSTFETLESLGAHISMVISVVDRLEGARELFQSKNINFQSIFTANDFV